MLINLGIIKSYYNQSLARVDQFRGLSIKGIVKNTGIPIPCRVRLYDKNTGQLYAEEKTNNDGMYEFNKLLKTKYFLVAHHPEGTFNAVIQDNVVPK